MRIRKSVHKLILALIIFLNVQTLDAAQPELNLRVGISPFKPFVILDGEEPTGLSIDAWRILDSNQFADVADYVTLGIGL